MIKDFIKNIHRKGELLRDEATGFVDIRTELLPGIFMFLDQSIGCMWEMQGIYDETLTHEEFEYFVNRYYKKIQQLISEVKTQGMKPILQVIAHQSQDNYKSEVKNYECKSNLASICDEERKKLLDKTFLIRRKFYLTVRIEGNNRILKHQDIEQQLKLFKNLIDVANTQGGIKLNQILSAKDYFQIVNTMIGISKKKLIMDNLDLSKTLSSLKIDQNEYELTLADSKFEVYSMKNTKRPISIAFGSMKHFMDCIPCEEYVITFCMTSIENNLTTDLNAKMGWVGNKPGLYDILSNFETFKAQVDSTRPYGAVGISIIVKDPSHDCFRRIDNVAVDLLCSKFTRENELLIHSFKKSLPLNSTRTQNEIPNRFRIVRLESALHFLPIYKGPEDQGQIDKQISRQGTLMSFDLFKGEGNKMTTILGKSRAGKGVLNNKIICDFLNTHPDGIVRVIDRRTSYKKLVDLVGGKVIEYSEEALKRNPASPFAIKSPAEDDIENLFVLIKSVLVQTNTNIEFEAIHGELLKESIKIAFNNSNHCNQQGYTNISNITYEDILSSMPQAEKNLTESKVKGAATAKDEIVRWSLSCRKNGAYGYLFCAQEEQQEIGMQRNRIVVYDLEGINDEVMKQTAAMMAFIKCMRDIQKLPKKTKKLIVFEELGMLLHGEDKAQKIIEEFVKNVVKTCAKMNTQAIAITNNVEDFTMTMGGKAFWDNSTIKIFLPVGNMKKTISEQWNKELSEADLQIINSLQINRELRFSEAYISIDTGDNFYKGSFRIPLTEIMDAITTTSPSQVEMYEEYRRTLTPFESIKKLAEEHPFGGNL